MDQVTLEFHGPRKPAAPVISMARKMVHDLLKSGKFQPLMVAANHGREEYEKQELVIPSGVGVLKVNSPEARELISCFSRAAREAAEMINRMEADEYVLGFVSSGVKIKSMEEAQQFIAEVKEGDRDFPDDARYLLIAHEKRSGDGRMFIGEMPQGENPQGVVMHECPYEEIRLGWFYQIFAEAKRMRMLDSN